MPPAGALLDQILQPGDLLYIPRGCYHVAVPMNEPALHLTLGVKNPGRWTSLWMVERLRTSDVADRDLPSLAGAAERLRYSEELRGALLDGLDPDLVEQYLSETGSNFKPRPSFSLPWSATTERLPPGGDFLVRLNVQAHLVPDGDPKAESIELQHAAAQVSGSRGACSGSSSSWKTERRCRSAD